MIVSSYYKHQIKTILVRKRREVIPADPKFMTDIDLTLPVFLYQDGESVVECLQKLVRTGLYFVPVAFCLLPDKKKESYQVMFSLLKNALDDSELELSAEYFMSDFEVAIRDAFLSTFPGIEAKGCAFHFAKAILSKVSRSGFKSDYQNVAEFSAFVRATLGLAYVPLLRLTEAIRNLYILAKKLNDRQASFALAFLKYLENKTGKV